MNEIPARALRDVIEPVAAAIYFSTEAHDAYLRLGFPDTPMDFGGVPFLIGSSYFTSRGACLGTVPGEVVAAAFGVFKPAIVVEAVAKGWSVTDRDAVLAARLDGAVAQIERILGPEPDGLKQATDILRRAAEAGTVAGHPIHAGLRSLGLPGTPIGDLWRAADLVREHRGDSHTAAWLDAGLSAAEVGLLTEQFWGLPPRSYVWSRGWSADDLDRAADRCRSEGWLDPDGVLTDAGRGFRERVEAATDAQEAAVLAAIGDDLDVLVDRLGDWSARIVQAKGYPAGPGGIVDSP